MKEAPAGETSSALNVLNTLCDIANAVPSFDVGAFHLDDPTCHTNKRDRFYYIGSDGAGNYAQNLQEATYCTIADGTTRGDATWDSAVGRFGAISDVRSFARNNQTMHIESEHLGKVAVFGVEVPLQYSTTAWDFPREHQWSRNLNAQRDTVNLIRNSNGTYRAGAHSYSNYYQRVPDHTGRYITWSNQNLEDWSIGGSGTIPLGVLPLHIAVKLKSSEAINNLDNARFENGVVTVPNYARILEQSTVCKANCGVSGDPWCALGCDSLMPSQINGHELKCGSSCNGSSWRNMSDGILPYSGATYGASANLLYGDPTNNYWQQGWPGSVGNSGEPQWSILSNPAITSTEFDFLTEASYSAGIAALKFGVKLDFDTRTGVSMRSRNTPPTDVGQHQLGSTELTADAETAINLSAFLNLHVSLPWPLSPIDLYVDYDIIDRSGDGHRSGQGSASGHSWQDLREDGTSDAGTASCVAYQTPQTDGPNPPKGGWDFVKDVAKASVEQLRPCNIRICVPPNGQTTSGTFTYYRIKAESDFSLEEIPSNDPCTVCDSYAAMCNAFGTEIGDPLINRSPSCGGTGDACGGKQVCDANDDCDGGLCVSGCCDANPK